MWHLAAFPYSSLLPMTGTNCKNHWSWKFISPSLALSTSCQSSSQITGPVHSQSVNSPSIYLIPIMYLFNYLAPMHTSISSCTFIFCTSTIPVFNCYFIITSPPWPIYCLNPLILPHLLTSYIDFFVFFFLLYYWLYVLFIPCVTLCCCMCRIAKLYLGQNHSCKWELVLN